MGLQGPATSKRWYCLPFTQAHLTGHNQELSRKNFHVEINTIGVTGMRSASHTKDAVAKPLLTRRGASLGRPGTRVDGSEATCAGSIALDGSNRPFELPRTGQLTDLTNLNCQGRDGVGLKLTRQAYSQPYDQGLKRQALG